MVYDEVHGTSAGTYFGSADLLETCGVQASS
jgi:hypothetical protein